MPWNTKKLQEAIDNGAEIYPGVTHVKVNNHMYKLSVDPCKRRAIPKQLPASRGSISHPGKDSKREFESKVYIYILKMVTLYWSKDSLLFTSPARWPMLFVCCLERRQLECTMPIAGAETDRELFEILGPDLQRFDEREGWCLLPKSGNPPKAAGDTFLWLKDILSRHGPKTSLPPLAPKATLP